MKTEFIIEGLTILNRHENRQDRDTVTVGSGGVLGKGTLMVYSTDQPVEGKDLDRMIEMGWSQNFAEDGTEFTVADYSIEELWVCHP